MFRTIRFASQQNRLNDARGRSCCASMKNVAIVAVAAAMMSVGLAGCGKDDGKDASTQVVSVKPLPVPTHQDKSESDRPREPEVSTAKLQPADAKDDAAYKSLFLDSSRLSGWVKTQAVTGGTAAAINDYLPELAEVLKPYQPVRVARAAYQRYNRQTLEPVTAILVEAPSHADAYGMLSVASPSVDTIKVGVVCRIDPDDKDMYILRGKYLGVFRGSSRSVESGKAMELLAGKIMFELPGRGGAPNLVSMFMSEGLPMARTFYIRDLVAMRGPGGRDILDAIGMTQTDKFSTALQLGPKAEFAIAAFTVENWETPDVLWVAKYPSHEQAMKAYSAYRLLMRKSSKDRLTQNTLIKEPRGAYLFGCWTMDAESLVHLMKAVEKSFSE